MFSIDGVIVGDVPNRNALIVVDAVFLVLGTSASSCLFFFRVRAVYAKNKIITAVFGFLLLMLLGTSFTTLFSVRGSHIGTTQRCMDATVTDYAPMPFLVNATYDTLVFITIT